MKQHKPGFGILPDCRKELERVGAIDLSQPRMALKGQVLLRRDPAELEEERRLFYVAITRAQQNLTISWAENRYRWGTPTICEPSRFISEIPEKLFTFSALPLKIFDADGSPTRAIAML